MNVLTLEEFTEKLTVQIETVGLTMGTTPESQAKEIALDLYANGYVMIRTSLEGRFTEVLVHE